MEKVTYGDVEYVRSTDGSSRIYYTYRHVPSGITYRISLYGEETDSTRDVLNNLELKLEDTGNVESPYPWEGTPYEPTLQNVAVGDFTIVPEYIPFNASQAGFESCIISSQLPETECIISCITPWKPTNIQAAL